MMDQTHKDDAERRLGRALVLLCEWGLRVQSPLAQMQLALGRGLPQQFDLDALGPRARVG